MFSEYNLLFGGADFERGQVENVLFFCCRGPGPQTGRARKNFCFFIWGPRPSKEPGGRPLMERLKTLHPLPTVNRKIRSPYKYGTVADASRLATRTSPASDTIQCPDRGSLPSDNVAPFRLRASGYAVVKTAKVAFVRYITPTRPQ